MKYIDADKLKAEIERLYYNEAEKDESILAADAYKNALDAVEKFLDSLQQKPAECSEDERMVKAIEYILYENYSDAAVVEGVEIAEIVAWLEKQKEQKPWSEEDENVLKSLRGLISFGFAVDYCSAPLAADMREWLNIRLKSLGHLPNWKPSEEHLSALLAILNDPNNIGSQTCQLALTDLYEQLKKLYTDENTHLQRPVLVP